MVIVPRFFVHLLYHTLPARQLLSDAERQERTASLYPRHQWQDFTPVLVNWLMKHTSILAIALLLQQGQLFFHGTDSPYGDYNR